MLPPSLARKFLEPIFGTHANAARDLVQADDVGALWQAAAVVSTRGDLAIAVRGAGGETFVVAGRAGAVDCALYVSAPDIPVAEKGVLGGVGGCHVSRGRGVGVRDGVGESEGGQGKDGEGEEAEEVCG